MNHPNQMEAMTEQDYEQSVGGWEPQNGMQWLGAKLHELWNHASAAYLDGCAMMAENAGAAGFAP